MKLLLVEETPGDLEGVTAEAMDVAVLRILEGLGKAHPIRQDGEVRAISELAEEVAGVYERRLTRLRASVADIVADELGAAEKAHHVVPKTEARVIVGPPPAQNRKKWPLQGTIDFQGLRIRVENRKGTIRSGVGADGKRWRIQMLAHYGEIEGTEGADGDRLDVYVGENADSPIAVVVHQKDPETGAFDEDKVMLGFDTVDEALRLYRRQYDRPGFYGGHTTIGIGALLRWAHDPRNRGRGGRGPFAQLLAKAALPVGHVSTYADGSRWRKDAPGKWSPVGHERQLGLFGEKKVHEETPAETSEAKQRRILLTSRSFVLHADSAIPSVGATSRLIRAEFEARDGSGKRLIISRPKDAHQRRDLVQLDKVDPDGRVWYSAIMAEGALRDEVSLYSYHAIMAEGAIRDELSLYSYHLTHLEEDTSEATRVDAKELRLVEDEHRRDPVETLTVYNRDGKRILTQRGDRRQVTLGPQQKAMIGRDGDAIVTHNHPNGSCFSAADVIVSMILDVKEMRATSPHGGVWILRRPDGGWFTTTIRRPHEIVDVLGTPTRAPSDIGMKRARPRLDAMRDEGKPIDQEVWSDAVAHESAKAWDEFFESNGLKCRIEWAGDVPGFHPEALLPYRDRARSADGTVLRSSALVEVAPERRDEWERLAKEGLPVFVNENGPAGNFEIVGLLPADVRRLGFEDGARLERETRHPHGLTAPLGWTVRHADGSQSRTLNAAEAIGRLREKAPIVEVLR